MTQRWRCNWLIVLQGKNFFQLSIDGRQRPQLFLIGVKTLTWVDSYLEWVVFILLKPEEYVTQMILDRHFFFFSFTWLKFSSSFSMLKPHTRLAVLLNIHCNFFVALHQNLLMNNGKIDCCKIVTIDCAVWCHRGEKRTWPDWDSNQGLLAHPSSTPQTEQPSHTVNLHQISPCLTLAMWN